MSIQGRVYSVSQVNGYIKDLLDRDGLGLALKERAADWLARRPVKSLDELRVQTAWCRKMLRRTQRGDAEGLFRLHWLLTDSLEICCDLLGRPYQGPKKSLRWLAEARPEGYALYTAALASPGPHVLGLRLVARSMQQFGEVPVEHR